MRECPSNGVHPRAYAKGMLRPEEVEQHWSAYSSVAHPGRGPTRGGTPARKQISLTLRHAPTGITVSGEVIGPFTRAQKRQAQVRLLEELLGQLELAVGTPRRTSER
jgi:hypothetical protein